MKIYMLFRNFFRKYRDYEQYEIDYESVKEILKNDTNALLIDVRSKQEYNEGHLNRSINIPIFELERNIKYLNFNKKDVIILYCQSGVRSKRALKLLKKYGFENSYEIKGGLDEI